MGVVKKILELKNQKRDVPKEIRSVPFFNFSVGNTR